MGNIQEFGQDAYKVGEVAKQKADYNFKINDTVRLIDGKSSGTIDRIEKNIATINYGIFTTQAGLNKLELVQAAK